MFEKVVLCETGGDNVRYIEDIGKYRDILNNFQYPLELVGGLNQVKPYFDIDLEIDKNEEYYEQMQIMDYKKSLQILFNLTSDKDIYYISRTYTKGDKTKYSYHFTIDKIRISWYNLKTLIEKNDTQIEGLDKSVYSKNRGMYPIYSNKKKPKKGQKEIQFPSFLPSPPCDDITKYLISYIEEDFEDYDLKLTKPEVKKLKPKFNNDIHNIFSNALNLNKNKTTDDDFMLTKKLVLECLSYNRAENYTDWITLGWCLRNIDYRLLDTWIEFSKIGSGYVRGECEEIWDRMKEGTLTIGSLKYWCKIDNKIKYEELINISVYPLVDKAIRSDGSHCDVANVVYHFFKDKLIYDTKINSWYLLNEKTDKWIKDNDKGLKVRRVLQNEICKLFLERCQFWNKQKNENQEENDLNSEKAKKSLKIANQLKNTGYRDSIMKEMKSIYANDNFTEDDIILIENDLDAAEHIINLYKDFMINCDNVKYVKMGNIWSCDDKLVKSCIYNWILNTPMKKESKDGSYIYYNREKTFINRCLDIIYENWLNFIKNTPNFIKHNLIKSKTYIPFLNGIYSMKEKKLLNYDDIDIQFTQVIDRNFPEFDKKYYDLLMEKIICPILPDNIEREYFMYCLARSIAGHFEDKKWFINRGSRNSGKGVITNLLQNSFQILVGTFNSGVLIQKCNENPDEAKNLSWVVKVKDKRLILSNEVDENAILWGKMLKKLASGGDTVVGRTNYKDELEFVPQFTMVLNLNNIKGVNPVDALESCEQFYCKSKFVPEDELIEGQPFLKLRDDKIKDLVVDPKYIDAFTLYLLEHYKDYLPTPECVKISTQDIKSDIPITLEQIMLKHFRYSKNNDDKLFTDEIIDKIMNETEYDDCINSKELQSIILKSSIGKKALNGKIRKDGKQLSGYTNIIFISSKED